MHISFIGMSNIGKTYWSKRLAADDHIRRIDCDALIEAKLGAELSKSGFHGARDVAQWMGQPSDPRYQDNSARYVACEQAVLREILDGLQDNKKAPTIIDTTGSVIYTGANILSRLRKLTRVVYLEASEKHIDDLFRQYVNNPKPVIWGDIYTPQAGEAPREALKRCYASLLRERIARYRALAHITIGFDRHKDPTANIGALIKEAGA